MELPTAGTANPALAPVPVKKTDLHIKDFQLEGIRNVIIDMTLRSEFHGSCSDPARNGEASYVDPNGAIDAAVKAKLDNYYHDYNERNFLFLPAVMTTSGRISGDFQIGRASCRERV